MAQTKEIPVILGPHRAGAKDGFATRPPLILVHLAADPDWSPESEAWPASNRKIYYALIDTGADACAIDEAAANEIGAPPTGNGSVAHGWLGAVSYTHLTLPTILRV